MLGNGLRIRYKVLVYSHSEAACSPSLARMLFEQNTEVYSRSLREQFLLDNYKHFQTRNFGPIGYYYPKRPFQGHEEADLLELVELGRRGRDTVPYKGTLLLEGEQVLEGYPQASRFIEQQLAAQNVAVRRNVPLESELDRKRPMGFGALQIRLPRANPLLAAAGLLESEFSPQTLQSSQFPNILAPTLHSFSAGQDLLECRLAAENVGRLAARGELARLQPAAGQFEMKVGAAGMALVDRESVSLRLSAVRRAWARLH